jgi:hypothetical protein
LRSCQLHDRGRAALDQSGRAGNRFCGPRTHASRVPADLRRARGGAAEELSTGGGGGCLTLDLATDVCQDWHLRNTLGISCRQPHLRRVLKNSKIAGLRKSSKCSALAISAAARHGRIDTRASDRFCGKSPIGAGMSPPIWNKLIVRVVVTWMKVERRNGTCSMASSWRVQAWRHSSR